MSQAPATQPVYRIGANPNLSYRIANLASLFSVCALAIDAAEDLNDNIRRRSAQDIKHVLEWGALCAEDACAEAEEVTDAGKAVRS